MGNKIVDLVENNEAKQSLKMMEGESISVIPPQWVGKERVLCSYLRGITIKVKYFYVDVPSRFHRSDRRNSLYKAHLRFDPNLRLMYRFFVPEKFSPNEFWNRYFFLFALVLNTKDPSRVNQVLEHYYKQSRFFKSRNRINDLDMKMIPEYMMFKIVDSINGKEESKETLKETKEKLLHDLSKVNKLLGSTSSERWFPFLKDEREDEKQEKRGVERLSRIIGEKNFNDHFKVHYKLGSGYFAFTYLCEIYEINELFAVKILKEHVADERKERMVISDNLKIPYHRNVVPIFSDPGKKETIDLRKLPNFEEFNSEQKIISPLRTVNLIIMRCYQKDLHNYIKQRKKSKAKFENREIVRILRGLIRGTNHLHKHGIVHKDLHAGNVFINERNGRLLIGDFGCHLKFEDFQTRGYMLHKRDERLISFSSSSDEDGYINIGEQDFLAPEIIDFNFYGEDEYLDFDKNDLFSVGMIGYKLVSLLSKNIDSPFGVVERTLPSSGIVRFPVIKGRKQVDYVDLNQNNENVDGEISKLIADLLIVKKESRIDYSVAYRKIEQLSYREEIYIRNRNFELSFKDADQDFRNDIDFVIEAMMKNRICVRYAGGKLLSESRLIRRLHTLDGDVETYFETSYQEDLEGGHCNPKEINCVNRLLSSPSSKPGKVWEYREDRRTLQREIKKFDPQLLKNLVLKSSFENLRLFRLLGRGYYGSTYLCFHENFGARQRDLFVIKVYHRNVSDQKMKEMFRRDCLSLDYHPNVVKVLGMTGMKTEIDLTKFPDYESYWREEFHIDVSVGPIIFMQHYRSTLRTYFNEKVSRRQPFSAKEICGILYGILKGATHLHKNKIVHRDLHMGNILLDVWKGRIWIGDFGCSLDLRKDENGFKLPKDDLRLTSFYSSYYFCRENILPPEVRIDTVDIIDFEKTDLYSLGIIGGNLLEKSGGGEVGSTETIRTFVGELLKEDFNQRIGWEDSNREINRIFRKIYYEGKREKLKVGEEEVEGEEEEEEVEGESTLIL